MIFKANSNFKSTLKSDYFIILMLHEWEVNLCMISLSLFLLDSREGSLGWEVVHFSCSSNSSGRFPHYCELTSSHVFQRASWLKRETFVGFCGWWQRLRLKYHLLMVWIIGSHDVCWIIIIWSRVRDIMNGPTSQFCYLDHKGCQLNIIKVYWLHFVGPCIRQA